MESVNYFTPKHKCSVQYNDLDAAVGACLFLCEHAEDECGDPSHGHGQGQRRSRRNICWKFNQGKCTYGMSCKFEHRCGICNKWGHGAHMCRRGRDENREFHNHDNETGEKAKHRHRDHEPRNDRYHFYKKSLK